MNIDLNHLLDIDKEYVENCMEYMKINDMSLFTEGVIKNGNDILYNKHKFDSGEINLLFVTGFSGSGKSTLSKGIDGQVIDMDKIIMYHDRPDEFFNSEPPVTKAFINGPGKKFRISVEERNKYGVNKFDKDVTEELLKFVTSYASTHKNQKFIMDGVWIFLFIEPSKLDRYAVYIKGTNITTSVKRASTRGSNYNKQNPIIYSIKAFSRVAGTAMTGKLQKYQRYFGPKYEKQISVENSK